MQKRITIGTISKLDDGQVDDHWLTSRSHSSLVVKHDLVTVEGETTWRRYQGIGIKL